MMEMDLNRSTPDVLARLMSLEGGAPPAWSVEDLGAMFAHQMNSALSFDLSKTAAPSGRDLGQLTVVPGEPTLGTFQQLFDHPRPPLELLEVVKEFGKTGRSDGNALPKEIATTLYYLAIAAALGRHGARISGLDDGKLTKGFRWVLSQPWIDRTVEAVIGDALNKLHGD